MKKQRLEPQLIAPPRNRNTIPRQRLLDLGQSLLNHQITTVVAPAGYGKTVWVSSLLAQPDWPATAWYSLEQQNIELYNFFYNLIQAVKKVFPDFGRDSLRTLKSLENLARDWSIAAKTFLAELPGDHRLILVFDDLHLVYKNEPVVELLDYMLQRLPENLQAVLIARFKPPFKLYPKELEGELLQIKRQELLFTPEEALDLFTFMGLELADRDLATLHARTEGWAVGLRLLGIYMKQSENHLQNALWLMNQEDSSFYQYLLNELVTNMPQRLRDFFLDASLLPYLETGLCNYALQVADSDKLLKTLYSYALFSPLEEEKGIWRMHHLLGDWLQTLAATQRSPDYIAAVRYRASGYFEQKGDINRAIEQAILGENWARAATLIHQYGYEYYSRVSHNDILYKWIKKLPRKLADSNCWLQYFKGTGIMHVDYDQAIQVLSAAADLASQNGDLKCEACCILAMMLSAFFEDKLPNGQAAAKRLDKNPALLENPLSRGEALTAALVYAILSENFHKGLDLSRQALRLKVNPELRLNMLYLSSKLHSRLGNFAETRRLIEETLSLSILQESDRLMLLACNMAVSALLPTGDFQAIQDPLQKSLELGNKYNVPALIVRIYFHRGIMNFREGRLTEALRDFDLTGHYASAGNVVAFTNLVELHVMPLKISNGENAQDLLPKALELLNWFKKAPAGKGLDSLNKFITGIVALEAGELEIAEQLFQECGRRHEKAGAKQDVAMINLTLAYLLLLQGQEKDADKLLRRSMAAAEAGQWLSFGWAWDAKIIYTMCRRALQKRIYPQRAARLLIRWFPDRSRQELGCLLISAQPETRSLAQAYFHDLWRETGTTVIHLFCLNEFRLFVNGTEIAETDWITQKAENLFKFLAVERRPHLKEHIIDYLWPEDDLDPSEGKLRMTLSYLRKSLSAAEMSSACVVMRRGEIFLDTQIEICCDYELFTWEAGKALHYYEPGHPYAALALEQALHFYQGEFLPKDRFEDWTDPHRIRLNNLYLKVLGKLAQAQYDKGDLSAAWQTCGQYLALEPVDEPLIRLSIKILSQQGKKQKAISLYRSLVTTLKQDYDTTPEPDTSALFYDILNVRSSSSAKPGKEA